ncbi:hypothetical protein [Okeania sp. KiyG1]|uniref:hypothetical protein n=1 Tax=Okeania sp. KiyG1 TaxID=2720165 RepID=UPI0019240B9C|nr:hypothetical protein [Okeania sp. KiyG1]GGA47298.1 hypothetical protein CYANOKiyG1_66400 [Okeania sp. KiyG1]
MLKNFQRAITLTTISCLTLGLTNPVKAASLDLTSWETLGDVNLVSNNQVLLSNDADLDDDYQLGAASGTFNFSDTPAVDNFFGDLEFFLGLNPYSLSQSGEAYEGSVLKTILTVKAGDELSFDWNFFTNETSTLLPEFLNDTAFLLVDSQIIKLADVADSTSASSLFDSETGLQSYTYQFTEAGNYTIGFGVLDIDDPTNSSALSVSNLTLNTPSDS